MSNRTTISIRATDQQVQMLDMLKDTTGMPTRSGVLMYALAYTYGKTFPSYNSKPTPVQGGSATTVVTKAKARALNKKIQTEEEENAIVDSGKAIARLLSARITNEGKGIAEIGMAVERLDNGPTISELASDIKLTDIPHTYYKPLEEDEQLQAYLLELKFRDLDLSAKPERLHAKLNKIATNLSTAIERGNAKPKQFTREVCELLLEKMKQNSVDCADLEQTLMEFGFMEHYAT